MTDSLPPLDPMGRRVADMGSRVAECLSHPDLCTSSGCPGPTKVLLACSEPPKIASSLNRVASPILPSISAVSAEIKARRGADNTIPLFCNGAQWESSARDSAGQGEWTVWHLPRCHSREYGYKRASKVQKSPHRSVETDWHASQPPGVQCGSRRAGRTLAQLHSPANAGC